MRTSPSPYKEIWQLGPAGRCLALLGDENDAGPSGLRDWILTRPDEPVEKGTWVEAKEVFVDALEAEGLEREKIIADACGDDSILLAEVERLLRAHEEAGDFLGEVTVVSSEADPLAQSVSAPPQWEDSTERSRALQTYLAGRYSFEGELGRGGMGVVYLARDVSLERPVAIKLLASDLGGRAEARERFLQEARTSARLSHPNIVPVHAVEQQGHLLYFVMAFIDGETVRERVRRTGPLAVGEVSRMLQEVAWALDYAHGRGVIHRDVKPDNIILERGTGRSVVTDFGIARAGASAGLTSEGVLLGTPEYVSPEQALGNEVDGRSDVYSLGVTCFFALTGRLPFEADSIQGMLAKHVQEPPPSVTLFRSDVPQKLSRAIDRCLAKDPKDRFATADGLADAIGEVRARTREVPAALQEVRKEAELLVLDGASFGALSTVVNLKVLAPGDSFDLFGSFQYVAWGIRITVWLLTLGLVGTRAIQIVRKSRAALAQGYSTRHLQSVFRRQPPETHTWRKPEAAVGLPSSLEASTLLALLFFLAVGWSALWDELTRLQGGLAGVARISLQLLLVVLPLLVGRKLGEGMIRRWPATRLAWAKLWEGRVGSWVFRIARIGFGESGQRIPETKPTEAVLADAAEELFNSLPPEYKTRLPGLPDLLGRLEAAAMALRTRRGELEQALASVGTVGSAVDCRFTGVDGLGRSDDFESVKAYRTKAVQDLDTALRMVKARLSSTVAAMENLRLGLLRLQAGVGSLDEVSGDLNAAREVGREVQSLLEGERKVAEILQESREAST